MHSLLFVVVCSLAADPAQPRFDPAPRLAITRDQLAAVKSSPDFAATRDAALRDAEGLLKTPAVIPTGAGDWTFYYACPVDASTLTPLTLTEHRCPKCMKVYKDERTVAAYRTRLHDQANDAAVRLGWAFAYSGDERFAAEVRRILLRYADDYKTYPSRRDRWGRTGPFAPLGGRRYAQSLDEAFGIIKLSKAYDLSRSAACWSDADRKHVEQDLFRATADTLLVWNQGINNHQTWYNAGLMSIASVLGDAALVNKVLDMRGGFRDQLKRSVGDDGLWYEGAMAYHNYALQAMIEIADIGRRLGLPLHEEPRFRSMITGPLEYAYPNGQFPAINDSDYSHVSSFDHHFRWAWKAYRDPKFVAAYARGDLARAKQLLGDAPLPAEIANPAPAGSKILASSGLAVLRRGTGPDAVCAMLDFGPHGGGHGHYDKLNLMLYAGGREWLLDPGRLDYSHKEYKSWVKHTAAHNTVALGGSSQNATTGKLRWFVDRPNFVAVSAESDGAYRGATLTRSLLLTEKFLVDQFDVSCAEPSQIDWFAHAMCPKLVPVDELTPKEGTAAAVGDRDGYPHLTGGRAWEGKGATRWEFVESPEKKLRMFLSSDAPAERIFTSNGIGYWIGPPAPCLTRRVNAKSVRFVTVYDLTPQGEHVSRVSLDGPRINLKTADGEFQATFTGEGATLQRFRE